MEASRQPGTKCIAGKTRAKGNGLLVVQTAQRVPEMPVSDLAARRFIFSLHCDTHFSRSHQQGVALVKSIRPFLFSIYIIQVLLLLCTEDTGCLLSHPRRVRCWVKLRNWLTFDNSRQAQLDCPSCSQMLRLNIGFDPDDIFPIATSSSSLNASSIDGSGSCAAFAAEHGSSRTTSLPLPLNWGVSEISTPLRSSTDSFLDVVTERHLRAMVNLRLLKPAELSPALN